MKLKKRIALINAREVSSFFGIAWESSAINTIAACLEAEGLYEIAVFPETEEQSDINGFEIKIETFIKSFKPHIVGISAWTSGYRMVSDISAAVRRASPTTVIAAGGPHFSSSEEIETALNLNEFDVIFRGGASPFIEFCSSYFKNKIKVTKELGYSVVSGSIAPEGICFRDEKGNFIINKRGKTNFPILPAVEINEDFAEIHLIVKDTCPNGCDYCVISPSVQKKASLGQLLGSCASICHIIKSDFKKAVRFSLDDSAPFFKIDALKQLLAKLEIISEKASFSLFADPQDIGSEMFYIISKHCVSSLFFGRDRVTEDPLLGRKYKGCLRKQFMLDDERQKLEYLITEAAEVSKSEKLDIYFGYILSPFETAESSKRLWDEIKYFANYGGGNGRVRLQMNLFILNPYPGTEVAKRFENKFIPMRNFYHPYPNVWLEESVCHFQMEAARFIISKLLCNAGLRELYSPLIDFVYKYQYEGQADATLAKNIKNAGLRNLALFIMESLAANPFKYEPMNHSYAENIINMHLLGNMAVLMSRRPELLKYGAFEKTIQNIKENDVFLPLLIKDIETIKSWHLQYSNS